MTAPEPAPPVERVPGRLWTGAAYAVVLVLAVQNAVLSSFLLPLRVGGTLVPVSLLLAGGVTAVLGVVGARVVRARWGAAVPGLLWVVLALMAGSRRSEGDLVIAGGEDSGLATLGLVFLAVGAVGSAAGYALSGTRPAVTSTTPEQPRPSSTSPEGPARR